jgi:hypothetical protein
MAGVKIAHLWVEIPAHGGVLPAPHSQAGGCRHGRDHQRPPGDDPGADGRWGDLPTAIAVVQPTVREENARHEHC